MPSQSIAVIYLVIGVGVAVALYLGNGIRSPVERWFGVATAMLFWPLYVPLLLARAGNVGQERVAVGSAAPRDELAAAIDQVDGELAAALGSLDGWAEDVLAREKDRFRELRVAWTTQAERIREMDRLLALPENVEAVESAIGPTAPALAPDTPGVSGRLRQSCQARRQNLERLRQVRHHACDELLATLAWVRELVSMIHLAKFTGAPASRAEELVAQIAAAVEGISVTTWRYEGEEDSSPRDHLAGAEVPVNGPLLGVRDSILPGRTDRRGEPLRFDRPDCPS